MKDENLSKDKLKTFISRLGHDLGLTGQEIADIIWLELKKSEFSQPSQDRDVSNFQQWLQDLFASFFTKFKNLSDLEKWKRANNRNQTNNESKGISEKIDQKELSAGIYNPNQQQQSSKTKSLPLRIPDPPSLDEEIERLVKMINNPESWLIG